VVGLSSNLRKIRVLVAKPGLDGHDRGVRVVARALRDAGMEVIYTGLHQTPEQVAETALQEDVDVVGLSILSGAHMTLVPKIKALLREKDMSDVLVLVGGIIPEEDAKKLIKDGEADQIFTPGDPLDKIIQYVRERFSASEGTGN
jgi:methylmalonyl-CoA mutase, C-terminal domain